MRYLTAGRLCITPNRLRHGFNRGHSRNVSVRVVFLLAGSLHSHRMQMFSSLNTRKYLFGSFRLVALNVASFLMGYFEGASKPKELRSRVCVKDSRKKSM